MKLKDVLKLIFANRKKTRPEIPEVATSIDDELENADWLHKKEDKGETSDNSN